MDDDANAVQYRSSRSNAHRLHEL